MIKLVVGLGNPGPRYAFTRHNLGFMIVDNFLALPEVTILKKKQQKEKGELTEIFYQEAKYLFLKPYTYMNRSGLAVREVVNFFSFQPEEILVVHDELDLPLGSIKFKKGGGTAGHNGLKSICDHLGSKEFLRMRVGIGRPKRGETIADYVLNSFYPEEKDLVDQVLENGVKALKICLQESFLSAQQKFNSLKVLS